MNTFAQFDHIKFDNYLTGSLALIKDFPESFVVKTLSGGETTEDQRTARKQ